MSATGIALGILGVWRIAHLLHAENGPGDVVIKLRRALGTSVFGRAMDCFDCLSLWIAMPFAAVLGDTWREIVLLWPALSAGAMLLYRGVHRLQRPAVAHYVEDPPQEAADVQLRQGSHEPVYDTVAENGGGAPGATRPAGGDDDHRL